MKADAIGAILDGQRGVRRDGSSLILDESVSATVFAGGSGELITVPRVCRIDLGKEFCTLTTVKSEKFFFPPEFIVGLKLEEGLERKKGPPTPGFR